MVIRPADEAIPAHSYADPADLPEEDFRWSSINLREILNKGMRLKAAVFDIDCRHARELLEQCKWPLSRVAGKDGYSNAFHRPRFKRIWLEKSDLPIYQPGQITEINPKPSGYLSKITETDIDALRVSNGQILMTCSGRSGSIGRTTLVSQTLHNRIFSHDLIRIECFDCDNTGFLYAFLQTNTGRTLVKTNEYGAMIPHIEPFHLETVPIPDPPPVMKKRIHDLVIRSYALRDESNVSLDKAKCLLYEALKLPPLEELRPRYIDKSAGLRNYSVKLSHLSGRLDASFHVPIVDSIMKRIKKEAAEITAVGDSRISKRVILPGRFARVYVQEGQGTVFFGGKEIYELHPSKKKYLSLKIHGDRIRDQLTLKQNMVMISCSGTIGKTVLVPKHWEGWTANQHIIRIEPLSDEVAGYLFVFLATDYGRELIRRLTYGSAVYEINDKHVASIPVPLLKDHAVQVEINRLALEANKYRTDAYNLEQEAIRIVNDEVIHAT